MVKNYKLYLLKGCYLNEEREYKDDKEKRNVLKHSQNPGNLTQDDFNDFQQLENFEEITKFKIGSAIEVHGLVAPSEGKGQDFEIKAKNIRLLGDCTDDFPIQPKRHTREFLREVAHLRPRTNLFNAVFRVRSVAAQAIHEYFQEIFNIMNIKAAEKLLEADGKTYEYELDLCDVLRQALSDFANTVCKKAIDGYKDKDVQAFEKNTNLFLQIIEDMDRLLLLPGVGRKVANLLLGDIYHRPAIVADTHCIRICGRLGLSRGKEPEKVEKQLRKVLPPEESSDFCHRIVLFGREICTARAPKCDVCPLSDIGEVVLFQIHACSLQSAYFQYGFLLA